MHQCQNSKSWPNEHIGIKHKTAYLFRDRPSWRDLGLTYGRLSEAARTRAAGGAFAAAEHSVQCAGTHVVFVAFADNRHAANAVFVVECRTIVTDQLCLFSGVDPSYWEILGHAIGVR